MKDNFIRAQQWRLKLQRHRYLFGATLREDHVYYIGYFKVASAKTSYQAVDCPIMARFTRYTKINEVTPVPHTFPLYAHTLASFDVLRTRVGQKRFLSGT